MSYAILFNGSTMQSAPQYRKEREALEDEFKALLAAPFLRLFAWLRGGAR
jgi:hypothetical protein